MYCAAMLATAAAALLVGCDDAGGASGGGRDAVVVIDAAAVSRALGRDQQIQQRLTSAGQQLQQQVQQEQAKYRAEIEAKRETFGPTPTDQQQAELGQMAQEANRRLNELNQQAQQRMQQVQSQLVNQFREELQPIARRLAEEHGASIAMVDSGNLLWYADAIDVTDQAIAALRAADKDAASQAAAPNAGGGLDTPTLPRTPSSTPGGDPSLDDANAVLDDMAPAIE